MNASNPRSLARKIQLSLTALLLFISLIVIIGEVIVRLTTKGKGYYYHKASPDALLGWRPKSDFKMDYTVSTLKKNNYKVRYTTTTEGYRHLSLIHI